MRKSLAFLPNGITILRFLLTGWFVWILADRLVQNSAGPFAAPYLLFAGICLTDLLDGAAARGFKAESALGSVLDVSADSLFILSSLILFNIFEVLPVWFTMFVLADFAAFLATSRLLIRMRRRNVRRVLVFDRPGKIAAVLFYFVPIAAWAAYSHPAGQSPFACRALLCVSAFLAGVSMSARLFSCFAALRSERGLWLRGK